MSTGQRPCPLQWWASVPLATQVGTGQQGDPRVTAWGVATGTEPWIQGAAGAVSKPTQTPNLPGAPRSHVRPRGGGLEAQGPLQQCAARDHPLWLRGASGLGAGPWGWGVLMSSGSLTPGARTKQGHMGYETVNTSL